MQTLHAGFMRANLLAFGTIPVLVLAGCTRGVDVGPRPDYDPGVTAADFVATIDNPFLPMPVGARWTYEVEDERIEVIVLDETRVVQGVRATVVRDTVTVRGEAKEDTFDWYAQDKEGNVWYLGEDTTEHENGKPVSHAGAWEWGKDGALPGIVMWADPQPNDTAYYQEFYWGQAIDQAAVIDLDRSVTIPLGTFSDTVTTKEWNPLTGGSLDKDHEVVHYAHGIGPVQKGVPGEHAETLVSYHMPG
jgi:hypothetical protein